MTDLWSVLLQTLTASGAAVLLLAVKAVFRDKLSPRWQFAVWGVLGAVLVMPAGLRGRYVLFNWPLLVETARSLLTGEHGALARVTAPVPLPRLALPETAAEWLYLLYLAGVLVLLAWNLGAYVRLRMLLRRGAPADEAPIRAAAEKYGLPVCPAVEVEGLATAFVCGVLRPVLALPAGETADEKVLLHELLHLKHRDAAWGLVICLFRCLHWCNPLLWHCANLAGNDLESLCDQRVLERLEGEDRRDYGRILLRMADERYARTPGTSSIANGGRQIRHRIEAIVRFKRYPAGMGLVSVCVALVLAAPLLAGTRAQAVQQEGGVTGVHGAAAMASARTTYCTTYAGALDTYAKAVLDRNVLYRAMCAPLEEQNALAEQLRRAQERSAWPPESDWDSGLPGVLEVSSGYQIYNLHQTGEEVYEGLLMVTLQDAPEGAEWDGTFQSRWAALQPLRAEREGDRWVVVPQGTFTTVQGDLRDGGNLGLPAWEYTAQAGDFTLRLRWQTASQVESTVQTGGFWTVSNFDTTPILDGEFTSVFHKMLLADYTGAPENRGNYRSIGVSYLPLWEEGERPELHPPGAVNSSGNSSTGEGWAARPLDFDWGAEEPIFLSGGGSQREGLIELPEACAADFYLNGERTAELTLLLREGDVP